MEIERKFLIDRFPDGEPCEISQMEQGYISIMPTVRIRSKKTADGKESYKLTFKSSGELVREEIEQEISEKKFRKLEKLLDCPMLTKEKRVYPLGNGLLLECSLVEKGEKWEFMYAEVEFPDIETANLFVPPDFLGEEITYDNSYKMNNIYAAKKRLLSLPKLWNDEENAAFSGWDFSHINDRCVDKPLPWDYKAELCYLLRENDRLLDMGTGGGEFLLTLPHPPSRCTVTEGYEPNYELCLNRLSPLGVDVRFAEGDSVLPFEDSSFDIVINRHESFNANELFRILKDGGVFITQQVGGENDRELCEFFGESFPKFPKHDLENNVKLLEKAGFEIIKKAEHFGELRFYDTGAIVYFAKVLPWEFPEFSVGKAKERLYEADKIIARDGFFACREHRFFISARKKST